MRESHAVASGEFAAGHAVADCCLAGRGDAAVRQAGAGAGAGEDDGLWGWWR